MTGDLEDPLTALARWHDADHRAALATVTRTWGSSPRPIGSQLAVRQDGLVVGSVSGGCIEAAVIHEALGVIADGRPRKLFFGVSEENAWEVGLSCGGEVEVFVEVVE